MAKRDKNTITLGSGLIYLATFNGAIPTVDTICTEGNLLGYIKGGAALTYTMDSEDEKDDLGYVSRILTTTEEAVLKCGLITWNGETLEQLLDRCTSAEEGGKRVTRIGGANHAKDAYYAICFHHKDPVSGDLWVLMKGRNTAGLTLTFSTEAGSVIEPEFKAMPHDEDGTLIQLIEEIDAKTNQT